MHSFLRVATLLAGLTGSTVAQVTFPLDARACFYRLQNDTAAPPLVLDLTALGAQPGEWLLLQSAGGFSFGTTPSLEAKLFRTWLGLLPVLPGSMFRSCHQFL